MNRLQSVCPARNYAIYRRINNIIKYNTISIYFIQNTAYSLYSHQYLRYLISFYIFNVKLIITFAACNFKKVLSINILKGIFYVWNSRCF